MCLRIFPGAKKKKTLRFFSVWVRSQINTEWKVKFQISHNNNSFLNKRWQMRATRSEVAVESFFPQSYGTSKQRNISKIFDFFFDMDQKLFLFWPYNRYPKWTSLPQPDQTRPVPGLALTLLDGLFLSSFKRYENETLTLFWYWHKNLFFQFFYWRSFFVSRL